MITNMNYVVSDLNSITVIDGRTNAVTKSIPVGKAERIAINPVLNMLYIIGVILYQIIDGKTNRIIGNLSDFCRFLQ